MMACTALACGLDSTGLEAVPPRTDGVADGGQALVGTEPGTSADSGGGTPDPTGVDAATQRDARSPNPGASTDSGEPPDATSSGGIDSAAPPPPPPPPPDAFAPPPDVSAPDTGGGGEGDDAGNMNDSCDADGDGHQATACGGDDCCDLDANAYPGQSATFTTADACGSFDYNCDGKESPEFGAVGCQLGLLTCTGAGFDKKAAACGATATFDSCDFAILTCTISQSQRTQACR